MDTFFAEAFCDPPSFLWPSYFWMMNDVMDRSGLYEQLDDMRRHDIRSVLFHPLPAEFRPVTMGTRMAPSYLSDAYFERVRDVLAYCRDTGMNYWLYDEGGWPSGGAAGRVRRTDPDAFACRHLIAEDLMLPPDETYCVPDDVVCLAVELDGVRRIYRSGDVVPAAAAPLLAQAVRVYSRPMPKNPDGQGEYADILNPRVAPTFVDLTHRQYQERVGEFFGDTIRFAFTDEPAASTTHPPRQLTWTEDLPVVFAERKGYDLVPWLHALFAVPAADEDPALTAARIDFYDVWSALFVERYLHPIREWCAEQGLLSSGHFGGEDNPAGSAEHGFGHILRALRGLDLPGIDTIWRQIFPGQANRPFPRYASSVARQKGQPYVLTESFAVYGSGLTPAQMKWITDYQYVRGATLTVLSNYPYSTSGNLMPGCRPHFGPTHPLWRYLDIYHRYVARLSYLLTRGKPVCSVAVHFPIRSIWAGSEDRDQAVQLHEELARLLDAAQCAYDFVDDDVLAGREGRVEAGKLVVGHMRYDTLIVPATRWMEEQAMDGLEAFAQDGGHVIAVEALPRCEKDGRVMAAPCRVVSSTQAVSLLSPLVRVVPDCPALRVTKRMVGEGALYFFTNESEASLAATVEFSELGPAVICDPEDGCLRSLTLERSHPTARASLTFAPSGSLAILFGQEPNAPSISAPTRCGLVLDTGWQLRSLRRYCVGETDYETHTCQAQLVSAELGDWRPWLGDWFSGDAEYSLMFHWDGPAHDNAWLDLGLVRYACEVELNDQSLGRRIWSPFVLPMGNALVSGENRLRIVVTNTLANALADPRVVADWPTRRGPGWPSDGHPYDGRARKFEADSLPSGLYGPVRVLIP